MDLLAQANLGEFAQAGAFAVMTGGLILGGLIVVAIFIKTFIRICPPNVVFVISGLKSGTTVGGRVFVLPGLQRVSTLSLNTMEVPISVRNGYSQGGIAMNVEAIANIKISQNPRVLPNAAERFLNQDIGVIRRVGKETLEGHLRGVIAKLTPEQVNEDRLTFAEHLTSESEEDLSKLGLHLDTLKILHVGDDVGYLDATGRKAIANIVRSAEIAESDAKRNAEQSEAENEGRAVVTRSNVDSNLVKLQNDLRRIKAELESNVKSEEERTAAAAREARAKAEQELQSVRAQLEALRLQADQVLPAEAQRQAKEYQARGEAALIRERGRAVSEALALLYEAWQEAGPNAKQITLIENLESILATATEGVKRVKIDNLNVIDKGDGSTLRNYVAAYPAMLNSVFAAVNDTVGIDIPGTVSGREAANDKEVQK